MTDDTAVKQVAAKAASGDVTFELLAKKPRRVLNFSVYTTDDAGEQVELKLRFQAVSSKTYDELVAAYPPKDKDKKQGQIYEVDAFAPALISAVSVVPRLTVAQAAELYTSDSWSGGEVASLYINALKVCNAGLDIPFSEQD